MKSRRYAHQSTIIANQLYLIGGEKYVNHYLTDTETIPISIEAKIPSLTFPEMHNERRYFGMCSFAGCIFVAGGYQKELGYLDKCEVYSFESCEWTETSSMNIKRSAFSLIYFQDKIWAIGGYSGKTRLDTIETFDLAENKWTTIDTKLLSRRASHSAVVHNKKFYVMGGVNNGYKVLSSVEVYSSETNQFSFVRPMNLRRADLRCCIVNSSVYVIGGFVHWENKKITDQVEIYDIEQDVWEKGPSLPLKLAGIGCSATEQ